VTVFLNPSYFVYFSCAEREKYCITDWGRRRRRQESLVCLAALDVYWNVAACSSKR